MTSRIGRASACGAIREARRTRVDAGDPRLECQRACRRNESEQHQTDVSVHACLRSMSACDADGCPMNVVSSFMARGQTRLARGTRDYSGDRQSEPPVGRGGQSEARADAAAAETAAVGGKAAAAEEAAAAERKGSDDECRRGAKKTKVLHGDIGNGKIQTRFSRNPRIPMSKIVAVSARLAVLARPEERRGISHYIQRERKHPACARGEDPRRMP